MNSSVNTNVYSHALLRIHGIAGQRSVTSNDVYSQYMYLVTDNLPLHIVFFWLQFHDLISIGILSMIIATLVTKSKSE